MGHSTYELNAFYCSLPAKDEIHNLNQIKYGLYKNI